MTSSSLVTLLVLALTAVVSPFSLIVFSLVLATDRGPRNGAAFIVGWIVTVVLIGTVMVAARGRSRRADAFGTAKVVPRAATRARHGADPAVAAPPVPSEADGVGGGQAGETDAWLAAAHRDDGLRRRVRARRRDADVAGDDRRRRRDRQAGHLVRAGDGVGGAVRTRHDGRDRCARGARHPFAWHVPRNGSIESVGTWTPIATASSTGSTSSAACCWSIAGRSASSDARRPPLTEVGGA